MNENKRYFKREWGEEYYIFDSTEISEEKVDEEIEYGYEIFADSMQGDKVVNRLNEQEEEIQELKQRNNRQFERLNEITNLMFKRDWKTLENMVDEWEKEEEQLEREWGTYGDAE